MDMRTCERGAKKYLRKTTMQNGTRVTGACIVQTLNGSICSHGADRNLLYHARAIQARAPVEYMVVGRRRSIVGCGQRRNQRDSTTCCMRMESCLTGCEILLVGLG